MVLVYLLRGYQQGHLIIMVTSKNPQQIKSLNFTSISIGKFTVKLFKFTDDETNEKVAAKYYNPDGLEYESYENNPEYIQELGKLAMQYCNERGLTLWSY